MQTNFLNVWILPPFAAMNIGPSVAFLTSGSDEIPLESRAPELLGNGQAGGNNGHNLVLNHLAWNCHELCIEKFRSEEI